MSIPPRSTPVPPDPMSISPSSNPTPSTTPSTASSTPSAGEHVTIGSKRQRTNTAGTATPGRGHHRVISSGEIDPNDIPKFLGAVSRVLHMVQELKAEDDGKWKELEEVLSLEEQTLEIIRHVKAYGEFVKKDIGKDVKVISFSKFDFQTLEERLGVTVGALKAIGPNPETFAQHLFSILANHSGARDLPRIQAAVKDWNLSSLRAALRLIQKSINTTSEAGCRMIIDNWIVQSMTVCQAVHPYYRSLLFPELHISGVEAEVGDLPAKIVYKGYVTYIPGTTDYALWTLPPTNQQFDDTDQENAVAGANNVQTLTLFTPHDTITLYEAKRKDKSLVNHIPQVVAECLALSIRKSQTPNVDQASNLDQIPFGLTNGNQWIFGVVDNTEKKCWRTHELTVEVTRGDNCLRAMMGIMLLWSIQPGAVLKYAMTATIVPTTTN